ncbi:MAG TPA: sodium:alanine symporter family protein [Epulopiscium sp.]|nr:sodium:alanine symporter family protein [Candidatus Epulonipiscium sp.]
MEKVINIFNMINDFVWGPPLLVLLIGTGIYLTIRLGFLQITQLFRAFSYIFIKDQDSKGKGDVSSFAALCTALAATIGTGNIVGVATAIATGGPGALFWMWVAAFFGMATKYTEGVLAIKYRVIDKNGQMSGGPMYYIERGLGNKWLAKSFAFFGVAAACLGIGTFVQVNAVSSAVSIAFGVPEVMTVAVVTLLVALIIVGGIKSISKISEVIVPIMAVLYSTAALFILVTHIGAVPSAIALVVKSAFTPTAALGGFAGATIIQAMQRGVARGIFSNEAGLGSAPIATAAAKTNSAVRQGLVSMTGTFIDTMVVCTMTGLTLIVTGTWNHLEYAGARMTTEAFRIGFGSAAAIGQSIVTIGLIFFAFTTIIGWNYYGERCSEYLWGIKSIKIYRIVFVMIIASSAIVKFEVIWILADILNGLMAIPNLIALLGLSSVVIQETNTYFRHLNRHNA